MLSLERAVDRRAPDAHEILPDELVVAGSLSGVLLRPASAVSSRAAGGLERRHDVVAEVGPYGLGARVRRGVQAD